MSENKNINLVFKSRNTILEILKFRGYNVDDYVNYSINEIHLLIQNNQLDMLVKKESTGQKVYLKYFNLDKSLRPNNVHEIIESLYTIEEVLNKTDELIIIIKEEPNETLEKLQTGVYAHDNIYINIININRLQFNILNHTLVPKHRLLSDEEKNTIKTFYNIVNDSEFPSISRFDPVSQVLGIKPGQVFEIERSSKTAVVSKFYRICTL